jgi:hypothetical protein
MSNRAEYILAVLVSAIVFMWAAVFFRIVVLMNGFRFTFFYFVCLSVLCCHARLAKDRESD